jgi:threonyl-tRNA synthetase
LRLAEYGTVTRKEKSGELNGLFRVAQITQDDAHIFITPDKIQEIVVETMNLAKKIYDVFGISFKIYLSTRPDDFMGDIKIWDAAEESLKNAIKEQEVPLLIKEKDGAFYGPKIDYQLEDSLGRTWQCGTIQLDFQMPEVFDLHYVGDDGNQHRPVIIHRTLMGSIERFIGILMEHYAAAFPVWLSPEQVTIIPIAERHAEAAQAIAAKLQEIDVRFELDDKALSMQKKIRNAQHSKVNYMLILGDTEVESGEVNVRSRDGSTQNLSVEAFINKIQNEIKSKI